MSNEMLIALLTSGVALMSVALTSLLVWFTVRQSQTKLQQEQVRLDREQNDWLFAFKTSYEMELYKARILEYAKMFQILQRLPQRSEKPIDAGLAREIAQDISHWRYSTGGLVSSEKAVMATRRLYEACLEWKDAAQSQKVLGLRDQLVELMRHDIGITSGRIIEAASDDRLLAKQPIDTVATAKK